MTLDYANINALAASLMVEELARNGIRLFCLSPGGRSAPLVAAAARHPGAHVIIHPDERGTAFYALGHARATGQPAVIICTSGTAVANLLPAVVEASMDMIPLIILSADRPPELRDTGANQTIRQAGIFGEFTRWQLDLPCPDDKLPTEFWLTTINQAVHRARRPPAGPVHLNCMYREPLAPLPDGTDLSGCVTALQPWLQSTQPFTRYSLAKTALDPMSVDEVATIIESTDRGLLIVGSLHDAEEQDAVRDLSSNLGWPAMPDIRSGLRLGSEDRQICHYYDLLLGQRRQESWTPGVALQIGSRFLSKNLLRYLERLSLQHYILVDNHGERADPTHRVTHRVESDIVAFCDALAARVSSLIDNSRLATCREVSSSVDQLVESALSGSRALSDAAVARLISRHIPPETGLFLASSLPIRLMNTYATPAGSRVSLGANRGASGIDGTVASAAGFADGISRPTSLLIGDLALLHDLNSLALVEKAKVPVTVVVLNNDGGGLFDFLPIAKCKDLLEPYFVAPHGKNFKDAAAMFNLSYIRPDSVESFITAYKNAAKGDRSSLIEVTVDRRYSLQIHQHVLKLIAEKLPE